MKSSLAQALSGLGLALRLARLGRSIDPQFLYSVDATAYVHWTRGRWRECVQAYDALPRDLRAKPQFVRAICAAHVGDSASARDVLRRLEAEARRRYVVGFSIGLIYYALGDTVRAFAWLERAYRDRSANLAACVMAPEHALLVAPQDFRRSCEALRRRVGLRREK